MNCTRKKSVDLRIPRHQNSDFSPEGIDFNEFVIQRGISHFRQRSIEQEQVILGDLLMGFVDIELLLHIN